MGMPLTAFPLYGWKPFKEEYVITSAAGTTEEVITEAAPSVGFRIVTRYSVIDDDNDFTQVRIVSSRGATDHIYAEEESLTADDPYWDNWPVLLMAGEVLKAIFTGTTDGDKLRLHVEGLEFWPAPPAPEEI